MWLVCIDNSVLHAFSVPDWSEMCRKKNVFQKLAGLWLVGEVVNHVGLYGSKVAEGCSAFQRRSCSFCYKELMISLLFHFLCSNGCANNLKWKLSFSKWYSKHIQHVLQILTYHGLKWRSLWSYRNVGLFLFITWLLWWINEFPVGESLACVSHFNVWESYPGTSKSFHLKHWGFINSEN